MTSAIKDKMLAEVKADLERVQSALRLVIITHDAAQQPMPDGLKGFASVDQFRCMHDELLDNAIAKARTELNAPTWLDRIMVTIP